MAAKCDQRICSLLREHFRERRRAGEEALTDAAHWAERSRDSATGGDSRSVPYGVVVGVGVCVGVQPLHGVLVGVGVQAAHGVSVGVGEHAVHSPHV
jgi:hypothetical protein